MKQAIVHVALVVRDYDEAIRFYTEKLNFSVVEDSYQPQQDKRWVLIAPPGSAGAALLLAKASTPEQERAVGNQTGGRVFLFLSTDDFWRDYHRMVALQVNFIRAPKVEPYGTVAVFEDLYGNRWDLLEWSAEHVDGASSPPAALGMKSGELRSAVTSNRTPDCAKCGRAMEPGFILDLTHGGTAQSSWVDGMPERSVWTGLKLKGHERLAVTTFRCPHCGYLESYAPPA